MCNLRYSIQKLELLLFEVKKHHFKNMSHLLVIPLVQVHNAHLYDHTVVDYPLDWLFWSVVVQKSLMSLFGKVYDSKHMLWCCARLLRRTIFVYMMQ